MIVATVVASELGRSRPGLLRPLLATIGVVIALAVTASLLAPGLSGASTDRVITAQGQATLLSGSFSTLAKPTSGSAAVVSSLGGKRSLELWDFATEQGPDLQVYLVAGNPTDPHQRGDFVSLGDLQQTTGSQRYEIPDGVNLARYSTVLIWCRIASAGFGKAPLTASPAAMLDGSMAAAPAMRTDNSVPGELLAGPFTGLAKQVTGEASILAGAGDARLLRLRDFTTEPGPDLHVYLVAGEAMPEEGSPDHVNLGKVPGVSGSWDFEVPSNVDLTRYTNVVIWCEQARVAFGQAPLEQTAEPAAA